MVVKLEPEKPFTRQELNKIRKENPELKFKARTEKGKQYIYITIENET